MGERVLSFRPLKLASRQLDIGIWSPQIEVKVRVNVWEPCPHRRCLHPQSRVGPLESRSWRRGEGGDGAQGRRAPREGQEEQQGALSAATPSLQDLSESAVAPEAAGKASLRPACSCLGQPPSPVCRWDALVTQGPRA